MSQNLIWTGTAARIYKVVHCLIRNIDSWSTRIATRNIWHTYKSWRPCNGGMGVVYWQHYGVCNSELCRRAGLRVSYCWRNVFCDEACCPSEACSDLGVGDRMVQLPWTGNWCCVAGIYHRANDIGGSEYELAILGWKLRILAVRLLDFNTRRQS
jgi:hypothetical protein